MTVSPEETKAFRPYRGLAWVLYLTVAVGFSSLIVVSVFRSVFSMTFDRPPDTGVRLTAEECVERFLGLSARLDEEGLGVMRRGEAGSADHRFLAFRTGWYSEKRDLEVRCAIDAPQNEALREVSVTMDRLMDLYATTVIQFSAAVGPTRDRLAKQVSVLKRAPGPAHSVPGTTSE
jgi:hypothetical protein